MKINEIVTEDLRVDVPNEEWLDDQINYAIKRGRNSNGVPYMGKGTANARDVRVPVSILKHIPGMSREQQNVRHNDLRAIMKIMQDTGQLPLGRDGTEYAPFINVAYNGEAWVNEGNHRIMAADKLGWDSLPVDIRYFDGGERIEHGPMYPAKIGLGGSVTEAPLADYQPMGNFNKPGPFQGADKRLIPHPTNQLKTARFFEKTPYDFRLFFSNIPGTGKYSEYGPMRPEVVQQVFKDQAAQILASSEDSITVVFVGNKGDSKVMLTPWIMAHRIGHAVQAGERSTAGTWRAAEEHFFKAINSLLSDFYGRKGQRQFSMSNDLAKEYAALFNAIGTQRSSRTGQITRPYEFMYELFAQYLGTGQIKLNPLPKKQEYGRKAWGRSTQSLNLRGDEEESRYTTEVLGRDMELMFDDVLSSMVGKILVM
jgi:hypothetical protein